MNKDLNLSATMFGFASSIFYVTYIAAEIPSNMMMQKFGARIWIPRIMITWGLASAATMFATGPHSLFAFRALTGLAEAGFMPGILLYLTYWFPSSYRARATAFFIMAQTITIMFGSSLSGWILDMHGLLGLAGWKWLFLLEGLPAVVLGAVAYFYLADRPETAKWLSERKRAVLLKALARDAAPT
jgi:MFS transporter, ACS family, 4-hydroxyphenylacetate permease